MKAPIVNALSLFSGVGMADLALDRQGVPVVAMAEIDPQARGVLRHQFPDVPIYNDVKDVTGDAVRSNGFAGPAGGLIVAGSPCQDLSVAGKRAGLDGARSGLWWEVVRIADETQAEWLIWENVPGALSSNGGRDFGVVLGSLVELGMGFAWRVLDSQHFGVPQRRRRIFLVARRASDGADCAQVLLEREGVRRNPAAGDTTGADTAADAAGGARSDRLQLFGQTGFARWQPGRVKTLSATDPRRPEDNIVVGNWPESQPTPVQTEGMWSTVNALTKGLGSGGPDLAHGEAGWLLPDAVCVTGDKMHTLTAEGHDASEDGTGRGNPIIPAAVFSVVPESGQGADLRACEIDVAPTVTATAEANQTDRGARVVDSVGVRRLTPVECERLMGCPDDWTRYRLDEKKGEVVEQADSSRYRQCGNGLVVDVMEWIVGRMQASA